MNRRAFCFGSTSTSSSLERDERNEIDRYRAQSRRAGTHRPPHRAPPYFGHRRTRQSRDLYRWLLRSYEEVSARLYLL